MDRQTRFVHRIALMLGLAPLLGEAGCFRDQYEKNSVVTERDKSRAPKISPASVQMASRVDELAQSILEENVFTGIKPVVSVIGVPETVLFHKGASQLFISEGMVKKCKNEAELAAVLCSELGQMMAQKRAGLRTGRDHDPLPPSKPKSPAGDGKDGDTNRDTNRVKEKLLAQDTADARQLASQLLKNSGFDPAELDRVEKLVKQSNRGEAIQRQMNAPAPRPVWNR